jgi:hypothetical protein
MPGRTTTDGNRLPTRTSAASSSGGWTSTAPRSPRKCSGLTEEQLSRCPVPPSSLSLIGLARAPDRDGAAYIRHGFTGEPISPCSTLPTRSPRATSTWSTTSPGHRRPGARTWRRGRNTSRRSRTSTSAARGHRRRCAGCWPRSSRSTRGTTATPTCCARPSTVPRGSGPRVPDHGSCRVGRADHAVGGGGRGQGLRGGPVALDAVHQNGTSRAEGRPDLGELEADVPGRVQAVVHEQVHPRQLPQQLRGPVTARPRHQRPPMAQGRRDVGCGLFPPVPAGSAAAGRCSTVVRGPVRSIASRMTRAVSPRATPVSTANCGRAARVRRHASRHSPTSPSSHPPKTPRPTASSRRPRRAG